MALDWDTEDNNTRILLVSDGVATEGLEDTERIQGLAAAYWAEGYGVTTIGLGEDFDIELMRGLAEEGGGSFYYLNDVDAVTEVFAPIPALWMGMMWNTSRKCSQI